MSLQIWKEFPMSLRRHAAKLGPCLSRVKQQNDSVIRDTDHTHAAVDGKSRNWTHSRLMQTCTQLNCHTQEPDLLWVADPPPRPRLCEAQWLMIPKRARGDAPHLQIGRAHV